jgi:hypothetical protein
LHQSAQIFHQISSKAWRLHWKFHYESDDYRYVLLPSIFETISAGFWEVLVHRQSCFNALLDWKFVSWFCFVWELVCVCVFSFFSCGDWFPSSFGVLVWWTLTLFSLKQFFMRLRFFWSFFYKAILVAVLNVCFLFRFRVLGVFAVTGDLFATEMSL